MSSKLDVDPAETAHPQYQGCIEALGTAWPDIAREFGSFHGITDVLEWMKNRVGSRTRTDIISRDECNYDFWIHMKDYDHWAVFSVT